jgi:hypothetical protein
MTASPRFRLAVKGGGSKTTALLTDPRRLLTKA